jgi:hypothetical protein
MLHFQFLFIITIIIVAMALGDIDIFVIKQVKKRCLHQIY